jgi:translocation and assembly module TamA
MSFPATGVGRRIKSKGRFMTVAATPGRAASRWAVWLLAVVLTGCALPKRDEKPLPDKPPPAVRVEVQAPRELERLLEANLDVARLPVPTTGPPMTEAELSRLVAVAPAQARELLETEGYFNAQVAVERLPGDAPAVRIRVEPGPQARVKDLRIEVRGPVADAAGRGDPRAREAEAALREGWPLPPGAVFRNAVWSEAKRTAIAQLRAQGYVAADWESTAARADAATQQVELELVADSGPLYRTGPLRIQGLNRHDERTVRNLANFGPGTPATEQLLLDYQERLQGSGLFDRATVQLEPVADKPEATPIVVQLAERKVQEATVGLGVDPNVGLRVTLEHTHRRLLGRALTARNRFELGGLRQAWEGEISTHTLPRLYRNLVGGAAERIESDTDVVTSQRLRVGRAQDTQRIDRLMFVEAERSLRRTADTREESRALTAQYHGIWRRVDDNVLPTRGHVLALQGGVGQASAKPGRRGPFARAYARLHSYWPLGSWYGHTRVELGQVFARRGLNVPEPLRFRAGGDESVRGYAYRSLAPVVDGELASGDVLFTASAEIARPFIKRLPDLWGAAFIDAGRAAERWSDLDPAFGYGVGVRYRSPIGPVRLDLAWGQEVKKLRLHLTVGVTF